MAAVDHQQYHTPIYWDRGALLPDAAATGRGRRWKGTERKTVMGTISDKNSLNGY